VSSPFLTAPGRRSGRRRLGALLAVLAGVVLAGAFVWLSLGAQGSSRRALYESAAGVVSPATAASPQASLGPLPIRGPAGVTFRGGDAFGLHFKQPPRAGLLFDLASGRVLWRHEPLRTLPIASLTKIMTALVVVANTTSREHVKITPAAVNYQGQGVGLPKGKRVPIEGLMHGMLIASGNDAAKALAIHVGGTERRFVRLMNRRADSLGLRCTHYASPHGLEPGNRSCAADLAAMARLAMAQPRIRRVAKKPTASTPFPVKGGRLYVNSTNPLYRPRYRGTVGLKTGFTNPAGRCYVGVVRRGGRRLGVVLLHSPDPSRQARQLFNAAFRRLGRGHAT
jgi:D-alanyl-D-alanine carboxypeptidase (penicillin-binding protein 5/6)